MRFEELVGRAAGVVPFEYQRRLAEDGLSDVLRAPTGTGKTLAATLGWLFRRRFHPSREVRAATPRWLVFTLPMRVLVEQTFAEVGAWLRNLGLDGEVGLYQLMGGEAPRQAAWRYDVERDAVFVATLDMALSRALNRGYGESRWAWPVDFGLFNSGTQWVFDEVQLMGPALRTSRQLEGLRAVFGTAGPCRSVWMSATVGCDQLSTVDNLEVGSVVELSEADRSGPLRATLDADKAVRELTVSPGGARYVRELAAGVQRHHRPGTRTIVVVNTVDRAVKLHEALTRATAGTDVSTVLVHSRFRPPDRAERVAEVLDEDALVGGGRIVVSTQVLEAGVDVSSTTLVTELAPWPSIVQRAGRCNRDGRAIGAQFLWVRPPRPDPYDSSELHDAADVLVGLEGRSAAPSALEKLDVAVKEPIYPVLRRRDLVELFDTLPDLSGNDVDVARFIRSAEGVDAQVAWRDLAGKPPAADAPLPGRDERCPVPLRDLSDDPRIQRRRAWRYDHVAERWVVCGPGDLRPGQVLIFDSADGGYEPERGWSPASRTRVPVRGATAARVAPADGDIAVGGDPVSFTRRRWVSLGQHLGDVEAEVRVLIGLLEPDLSAGLLEAAVRAGRYHDLGKAHPVFQSTLERSAASDDERAGPDAPPPWAKSGGTRRPHHERPHFRHELVSALALLPGTTGALDGVPERDLVVYLVAAHHGRVRMGFRSLPDESPPDEDPGRLFALGVWDGDELPAVEVPGETVPGCRLDLSAMLLGQDEQGTPSWAQRAAVLRDRDDLGPFRLAFLEAVVRVADWRVSQRYDQQGSRS